MPGAESVIAREPVSLIDQVYEQTGVSKDLLAVQIDGGEHRQGTIAEAIASGCPIVDPQQIGEAGLRKVIEVYSVLSDTNEDGSKRTAEEMKQNEAALLARLRERRDQKAATTPQPGTPPAKVPAPQDRAAVPDSFIGEEAVSLPPALENIRDAVEAVAESPGAATNLPTALPPITEAGLLSAAHSNTTPSPEKAAVSSGDADGLIPKKGSVAPRPPLSLKSAAARSEVAPVTPATLPEEDGLFLAGKPPAHIPHEEGSIESHPGNKLPLEEGRETIIKNPAESHSVDSPLVEATENTVLPAELLPLPPDLEITLESLSIQQQLTVEQSIEAISQALFQLEAAAPETSQDKDLLETVPPELIAKLTVQCKEVLSTLEVAPTENQIRALLQHFIERAAQWQPTRLEQRELARFHDSEGRHEFHLDQSSVFSSILQLSPKHTMLGRLALALHAA